MSSSRTGAAGVLSGGRRMKSKDLEGHDRRIRRDGSVGVRVMKILIVGRGASGNAAQALADALKIPAATVSDAEVGGRDFNGVFDGVTLVVVSPGVTPQSPLLRESHRRGLTVISELKFGALHFPGRMLAVTGTNGKTTTVELATYLLERLGFHARYAGNIGRPLSELSAQAVRDRRDDPDALAVVEVSSFQLEYTHELGAEAAVILNVESDHLNRYPGGMSEYRAVKERIFDGVKPENRLYGISMREASRNPAYFSIVNDTLHYGHTSLLKLSDTALNAPHNQENLLAALELIARVVPLAGREAELAAAIGGFKTGEHRLSEVATVRGVRYIDDSKATNPAAVIAALRTLAPEPAGNIVLLAGGLDKAMDFTPLGAFAPCLRKLIVYGACGAAVAQALAGRLEIYHAVSFEDAFAAAHAAAKPGDIVLLSPAAASMDMFKDYKARGDAFARLVRQLN